jgi:putative lysine transport system permease protein
MSKVLKKVFWFAIAFGIVITFLPKSNALQEDLQTPDNPLILEALENIKFYSSFNYQTMTEDKLLRTTTDFYLPTSYYDVSISYTVNSEYLLLNNETEIISLRTGDQEVVKVSIIKFPSVFQGEQAFLITASFSNNLEVFLQEYLGAVIPVIPDDFFGGAIYTLITYAKMFIEGAAITLGISLLGTVIGFILALFIATSKLIKVTNQDPALIKILKTGLNKVSSLYITIFRGTPMIVQASFFWYGFGLFGDALLCGLFVVSLNTAAYIAEIIRGGIISIDKGQTEAALSVGLNYSQTMLFVVFPQAIKNSMPAIGNEFVINIKDTAVLSVIGIFELFNQTRKITGMHYRQLEAYAIVALIYLFLTYSTTSVLKYVEKKMDMQPVELVSSN